MTAIYCTLHCHWFHQLNFCGHCLQLNPWLQVLCWGLGIQQACSGACDHRMLTLNWMHILVAWTQNLALKTLGKILTDHRTWCSSWFLWSIPWIRTQKKVSGRDVRVETRCVFFLPKNWIQRFFKKRVQQDVPCHFLVLLSHATKPRRYVQTVGSRNGYCKLDRKWRPFCWNQCRAACRVQTICGDWQVLWNRCSAQLNYFQMESCFRYVFLPVFFLLIGWK